MSLTNKPYNIYVYQLFIFLPIIYFNSENKPKSHLIIYYNQTTIKLKLTKYINEKRLELVPLRVSKG